jgi:SAM-dependent methyltransferase
MTKKITPEQEYQNPNDFYTQLEAKRYDSSSGMKKTQILLTNIALELSLPLSENKKINILDIGCGTGFSMEYLLSLGYKNIKGIDPSVEMIKIASKKKLDVSVLGFENLNKIKQNYDLIISISAFHWSIANKENLELKNYVKKIGKEIYRILYDKGICIIQFYPVNKKIYEDVVSSFNRLGFMIKEYIYNEDSVKKKKYFVILKKV